MGPSENLNRSALDCSAVERVTLELGGGGLGKNRRVVRSINETDSFLGAAIGRRGDRPMDVRTSPGHEPDIGSIAKPGSGGHDEHTLKWHLVANHGFRKCFSP